MRLGNSIVYIDTLNLIMEPPIRTMCYILRVISLQLAECVIVARMGNGPVSSLSASLRYPSDRHNSRASFDGNDAERQVTKARREGEVCRKREPLASTAPRIGRERVPYVVMRAVPASAQWVRQMAAPQATLRAALRRETARETSPRTRGAPRRV